MRCTASDWLGIASYLVWGDYGRSTKFQNGCLRFSQCYRRSNEHDKANSIPNSTKDASKFWVTLFKRKAWRFFWLNLINLSNPSGNWLFILTWVIKTIETEWVQCQNKHLQQISKAPTSNHTKTIICLMPSEYSTTILTSPSVNNCWMLTKQQHVTGV